MNNGPRTVAGMLAVIAVSLPAALTPVVTGQCNNPYPSPDCTDAQIGIQGNFVQECDACGGSDDPITPEAGDGWSGLAFPFQTGGAPVDAVTSTLNSNVAGGDIWIMGNVPNLLILLAAWGACQQPTIPPLTSSAQPPHLLCWRLETDQPGACVVVGPGRDNRIRGG